LSPSITKGSSAIDLGKNSGVDMGRKSQPSLTSGGIGVTQEVTNVGGVSVSAGANIDITPVDFGININPSEGTVLVATEAEIPGGLLGISGGIEVDLNTGEVIGGSIGGEVGGFGINLSNSKNGGVGVEFTYQIGLIEFSVGFRYPPPPKDQKDPTTTPTPTPTPTFSFPPAQPDTKHKPPGGISIESVRGCTLRIIWTEEHYRKDPYASGCKTFWEGHTPTTGNEWGLQSSNCEDEPWDYQGIWAMWDTKMRWKYRFYKDLIVENYFTQKLLDEWLNFIYYYLVPASYSVHYYRTEAGADRNRIVIDARIVAEPSMMVYNCTTEREPTIYNPPSNEENTPPPPPFPNPPPRRQTKMDTCCRENLAFLRAIYTRLGLARFPGQLPNTIIQEVPKEGEEPAEPPQVPIPDLVSLLNWQFERDDERWGQWKVQINIKDSDVTQEGDQEKSVKFPNLAESIAEIEGQILSLTTNVDALVAITTKNLVESGLGRQEAIKSYLAAKSIIKYMAFKSTEIDVTVPVCFTPGAETIHELIAESEVHVKGLDYTEKETLRDVILDLLQAAAVIRAVHWQRIDTKKDTKSQLLGILKGSIDLANSIKSPTNPTDGSEVEQPNPAQNFEDFLDSAESGFTNTTGITDVQNPYGKTPDRRPRIRQIGDNISQAGNNN
jgi:hypothetical protein